MKKVAVGYATILGTLGAIAGLLIPMIAELRDVSEPLGVPAEVFIYGSVVLSAVVIIGRYAQAVAQMFTES